MLGKISASLNDKLKNVKWGEYRLDDLFEIKISKSLDEGKLKLFSYKGKDLIEFIGRTRVNNGVKGYMKEINFPPNDGNTISISQIGSVNAQMRTSKWYASQNMFVLKPKNNKIISLFTVSAINKSLSCFSNGYAYYPTLETLKKIIIKLPIKDNNIDLQFMESLISELEEARINKLSTYLKTCEMNNYVLTPKEQNAINNYSTLKWKSYNLESLFGKSTRGKRLKSSDRIAGTLPFVTAGEANEGVSAFIGNKVQIFNENTTTIDMFGSAKYRNYKYGGDDHIAVVHTENLPTNAAIFVTTAIHKSSHNGQFNYGRNFYAKDADKLNILLPSKNEKPDYETMEILISAIKKLVIKDVIKYTDKKLNAIKYAVKE